MRRRPKKPRGTIGQVVLGSGGWKYESVSWPETKEAIENHVLDATLTSAHKAKLDLYDLLRDPVQNIENDFDFTLYTRGGVQFLDLMEVAPLQGVGGSHSDAPGAYIVGDMADAIWHKINKKSERYGTASHITVHLLLYPTDWRFRVGREVTDLLSYWSLSCKHSFASMVYFAPNTATAGEVVRVYPRSREEFLSFDENDARDHQVLLANLSEFTTRPSGSIAVGPRPNGKSSAVGAAISFASLTVLANPSGKKK